jgi:TIGR03009 family protein
MRKLWWTLVVMALSSPIVLAQQGGAPAQGANAPRSDVLNPTAGRLDSILASWEASMSSVRSASAQVTHTLVNKVLKDQEVFEGTAQFMKPNLAILDLKMKGRPQDVEHVVCTGTFAYQFNPGTQVIKVYELKTGLSGQDNFLPFLQGMKAQDVKARYDLTLIKEDKNYTYLKILPRLPEDKADFREARLVLWSQNYLPRELRFLDVNGNENIWDIPKIQANDPQVTRNTFTAPKLPTGWKWEKQQVMQNTAPPRTDIPPRVIRPNQ